MIRHFLNSGNTTNSKFKIRNLNNDLQKTNNELEKEERREVKGELDEVKEKT